VAGIGYVNSYPLSIMGGFFFFFLPLLKHLHRWRLLGWENGSDMESPGILGIQHIYTPLFRLR
jgi:CRISPR/Cas system endoribonuclease Cas6 (RAMP superfamily)